MTRKDLMYILLLMLGVVPIILVEMNIWWGFGMLVFNLSLFGLFLYAKIKWLDWWDKKWNGKEDE